MKLVNFQFGMNNEFIEVIDTHRIISMSKEKGGMKLQIILCGSNKDHVFEYSFSSEECRDVAFSRLLIMSNNRGVE